MDCFGYLLPKVDQSRLDGPLYDLVEALPPGVEPVESPPGKVGHEDGVRGEVDEGVSRGGRVVHVDGRLQAGLPVDEDGLSLVDNINLK